MCKYCESNGNAFLINKKVDTTKPYGLQVALSFGRLGARCYGDHVLMTGIDINYCPMCGRNLAHEKERLEDVRKRLSSDGIETTILRQLNHPQTTI